MSKWGTVAAIALLVAMLFVIFTLSGCPKPQEPAVEPVVPIEEPPPPPERPAEEVKEKPAEEAKEKPAEEGKEKPAEEMPPEPVAP